MAEYSGKDKRLAYLFDAVENVQVDDMTGASASTDGAHGLVPAPLAGDEDKYLKGDGTWAAVQAGAGALSGLSDVDLSSPTDGQALVYDGANSKWINGNVSGGGGTGAPMKVYEGAWTAASSSGSGTTLTETLNLPEGNYLVIVQAPYSVSTPTTLTLVLAFDGVEDVTQGVVSKWGHAEYFGFATIIHLSQTTAVKAITGSSVSVTWDSNYLNRGWIKAVALSQPQTALIYSTEEREVGVWTDGKPLYQKTLYYNEHLYGDINKDVTSLNIDTCVDISGMTGEHSQWGYCTTFGYARQSSSANITALYNSQNKQLQLRFGSDYSSSAYFDGCNITLLYTKTTDVAGSGTWITTGEYAHHYSTSEKVVGTWIDGSTLYEITVTTGASAPTGATLLERRAMIGYDVLLYIKPS